MYITLVKKIMQDGAPCRKCADVEKRLQEAELADRIDRIVIADERDPDSEGMQLARGYNVNQAPFFIVRNDNGNEEVYTVYFRFLKEVLQRDSSEQEAAADIIDSNPDLDFI